MQPAARRAEEMVMAKGQKRSNKEAKKPKKDKTAAPAASTGFMPKGRLDAGKPKARG
jgi:hypothetical protein